MTGIRAVAMPDLVRSQLAEDPESPALVVDGHAVLTRGEWERRATRAAGGLAARGVKPGVRVGVICTDWIDYAITAMAVHLAGGTVVGLSPRLPGAELVRRLENCSARGVVRTAPVHGFRGWTTSLNELELGGPPAGSPDVDPESLAEILHTSGTTGVSKAVAVTHANITYGRAARGRFLGPSTDTLCAVAVGTNAGHSAVMLALTSPGATHVLSSADPETVAAAIARHHIEAAIISPWILQRWVADDVPARHDFTTLRTLMIGSSAVPMATLSALSQRVTHVRTLIGYGATEAVPASVHTQLLGWDEHCDPEYYRRPRPVGAPAAGTEIKIVDSHGKTLGPNELGEICLRGPAPTRWYHGDPTRSARVFVDGWVRMGDHGHVDENGDLYFFDRSKDVIRRAGQLISSSQVEGALLWHPKVAEAAAFAVPDLDTGFQVAAGVVLTSPVAAEELGEFVRSEFGDVRILVMDSLPRGEIGKPLKRTLRVEFADWSDR
ncbi:MAG: class I adenylate-forming enzyme family protein [Umezawaea sp.]